MQKEPREGGPTPNRRTKLTLDQILLEFGEYRFSEVIQFTANSDYSMIGALAKLEQAFYGELNV